MTIVTTSHLVDPFVKNILAELWQQYQDDFIGPNKPDSISFDKYAWEYRQRLGEIVYEQIGEMYGDLDGAINEVME